MKLGTIGKRVVALGIVAFIGVLAIMIALSHHDRTVLDTQSPLENYLMRESANGVQVTTIVPADLYGDIYDPEGPAKLVPVVLCAGDNPQKSLGDEIGIDFSPLHLNNGKVPEGHAYMVLVNPETFELAVIDRVSTEVVDLCAVTEGRSYPLQYPIITFESDPVTGSWRSASLMG